MGDRCYLRIFIKGHIKSIEELLLIETTIMAEGFQPEYYGDRPRLGCTQVFAEAVVHGHTPEFYMDECNYANVEETEGVLQQCEVAYYISHGSGDEYPAGCRSWTPERGHYTSVCGDGGSEFVELVDLEKAFREDPINAVATLIQQTKWAGGADMPEFSVSEDVKLHLAKVLALDALGVKLESRPA